MPFNLLKNYKHYLLAGMLVSLLLLTPSSFVHAGPPFFGKEILGILYVVTVILGKTLQLLTQALSYIVSFQVNPSLPIIGLSWGIVRDFSNMFFIVVMIIMAFATIFDLGSFGFQGYDINSLIAKFLIAALLINFSLAISGLLINGFNVFNTVMLNAMGDISATFLKAFKPTELVPPTLKDLFSVSGILDVALGLGTFEIKQIPGAAFSIFILLILILAMLVPIVAGIVRIPIIWLLLIFSPLAYLASVLPATRGLSKKWWEQFLRWNAFFPVFLLVLYLGMTFLGQGSEVMDSLLGSTVAGSNGPLVAGLSFSIQSIFFYLMIAFILIGGTSLALSGGVIAGTGGIGIAQTAANSIRGFVARGTGATALGGALRAGIAQVQQQGLPGRAGFLYGGQAATARQQARFEAGLGIPGARGKAEQLVFTQQEEKIKQQAEGMKNITGAQELRQLATSGSVEQRIAARKKMAEMDLLSGAELRETYSMLGGDRSPLARDFANKVDFGKLSAAERADWQRTVSDIEVKKKVALAQADKGDIRDPREITELTNLYRTTQDKNNFLEKIMKNIAEPSRLRQLSTTGSNEQQIAALKRLNELGELNGQELRDIYGKLGGDQSPNAREFANKVDFGKLTGAERKTWQDGTNDLELKKKIALVQADKGDFRGPQSRNEIFQLSGLFRSDAEKGEFLDKIKKKNFQTALRIKTELGLVRDKAGKVVASYIEAVSQEIRNLKIDDLVDFPVDMLSTAGIQKATPTEQPVLIQARKNMIESLSQKKIGAITEKVSAADLAKWDELFQEARNLQKQRKQQNKQGGGGQQPPTTPAGPGTPPNPPPIPNNP